MAALYEIRDAYNPKLRGARFNSLDRALREMAHCVGDPGRWELVNRQTGAVITRNR